MAIKIARLPKVPPLPNTVGPAKPQPSVSSQIYRNNREAMRAVPMTPQKYPKFMGKTSY